MIAYAISVDISTIITCFALKCKQSNIYKYKIHFVRNCEQIEVLERLTST